MKILLLAGGTSEERSVSQKSGDNVEQALRKLEYEVVRADPAAEGFNLPHLVQGVDLVFPILHGKGGEDGVLQKQLEGLGVPFLGSDSAASHVSFDKVEFKRLLDQHHLSTPKWQVVSPTTFAQEPLAEHPFVLKPIDGGSSIDAFIVRDPARQPAAIKSALVKHQQMLLEELIEGHELTVSVLGDQALPVILIVPPKGEEFDYDNKYNGKSREIAAPKEIAPDLQKRAQELALQIHVVTGCRHFSRTDIMATQDGVLSVLEINTIPGLTAESLLPKAAAAAGLDMTALARQLVALAQS